MKVEKYHLRADETLTVFEFISEGPKGAIRKLIHFQPTNIDGLYNLAFGDKHLNINDMDDLAVTNNGDTDKVLGTVVAALYAFLISNQTLWFMQQAVLKQERVYTGWELPSFIMK